MYRYKDPQAPAAAGGVTEEQAARAKAQADMRAKAYKNGYRVANLMRGEYGKKSAVSEALEGATIKFGTGDEGTTFDTGISWTHKKSLAAAIGFGDQVGDAWRGIKQIAQEKGFADDLIDIQAQDENENILRALYADPEYGGAALVGGIAGALAEPVGLLMPIGKAKSVGTAMLAGAALGGAYGSALYIDENESRLHNAAIGAALMGPMAGIAQKFFSQAVGGDVAKVVDNTKDDPYGPWKAKNYDAEGNFIERPPEDPYGKWKDKNLTKKGKLKKKKKEDPYGPWKKKQKELKKGKTPDEVVDDLEVRAAVEGKRHGKISQMRQWVDGVLQPLYDNVRKFTPKVAHGLRSMDAIQHRRQHVWTGAVKPFQKIMKQMDPLARRQLKKLIHNGGFNKATMTFLQQQAGPESAAAVKDVRGVLNEIFDMYRGAGYKIGKGQPNYFPLSVKDLDGLRAREVSALDAAYAKAVKGQGGRPLTPSQKAHIDEHFFTFDVRYSNTSGNIKARKKAEVKDEELDFYHDPADALHYYIHTAAEDISKREFFKSFGYRPPANKGLNVTGTDIDDSITSLIDQIKKDVPDVKDQQHLSELLRSRFSADVHKTHKFVQAIKNLSYAGTLGNYWSAMTQVGDLVFAFHKYGIRSTVGAMLGPKVTSRAELGVEKAMAELQSETQGFTTKLADWSFKWSGFDAIDRFGKNVNINAALRKNRQMALRNPEKFLEKYGDKFGEETDLLLRELQNMKMTKNNKDLSENMYLMLWNELADTQPIGLSEMPQKYLDMPNGRILYAYKTFAMKQLAYMRNQINNDKNPFVKGYNLTMFASMFVAANSSIDGFKDFMAGKPVNMNDKVYDNILSLAGTSKYATDKSSGLGGVITQIIAPVPLVQGAKALDNVTGSSKGWGDVANEVANWTPVAGRLKREYVD